MCCSTTECLDADRSGAREKVQHATVREPVAKNGKQCFPDSVGGRTKRSSVRSLKASTPVGSSYNSHDFRYIAPLRESDCNTAFLKGSSDEMGMQAQREPEGERRSGAWRKERECDEPFDDILGKRYKFVLSVDATGKTRLDPSPIQANAASDRVT